MGSMTFLFISVVPALSRVPGTWVEIIVYWNNSSHFSLLLLLLSCFSHVWLCDSGLAHQAPLSVEFSKQEYWSGLPFPPPGDLPDPRIESMALMSPTLASGFFTTSAPWEALICPCCWVISVVSDSLWPHGLQPAKLLCPCDSPGKNTGVGCHFLLHHLSLGLLN